MLKVALFWILVCFGATDVLAGDCRNSETGEVVYFDGPCPAGWWPSGGWVE